MSTSPNAPLTGNRYADPFIIAAIILSAFFGSLILHTCVYERWYGRYHAPISLRQLDRAKAKASQQQIVLLPVPSETPAYTYDKLPSHDHIRLLVLHPGQGDGPIRCSLQAVKVGEWEHSFEALSYRWGTEKRAILCEDKRFDITDNLYSLLVELRYPHNDRFLWADAICIDQEDNDEKNIQLRLMAKIYTECDDCIIWLGWHSENMALAFELLSIILTKKKEGKIQSVMKDFRAGSGKWSGNYAEDDLWKALGELFANEWFDRIWCLQEGVLPNMLTFHCGNLRMDGADFFTSLNVIRTVVQASHLSEFDRQWSRFGAELIGRRLALIVELSDIRQNFHKRQVGDASPPLDLLETLRNARGRNATDAHDKVNGILGLFNLDSVELGIDYNKPPSATYTIIAEHIISSSKDNKPLRLLSAASYDHLNWHNLPSWVPNWKDPAPSLRRSFWEHDLDFCAGGQESPETIVQTSFLSFPGNRLQVQSAQIPHKAAQESIQKPVSRRRLHVRGKLVASLKSFIERWEIREWDKREERRYNSIPSTVVSYWHQKGDHQIYLMKCFNLVCEEYMGESLETVMNKESVSPREVRELKSLFGQVLARTLVPISLGQSKLPDMIESVILSTIMDSESDFGNKYLQEHREFFNHFDGWTTSRKFAAADDASTGWVPQRAQKGDFVCVIQGCDLPFILREVPHEETFVIIGHCCFPDVMYGQAMENESIKLQEIVLD